MATVRKSSCSKLHQKSLKCSVRVNINAVSCPGVLLSQKSFVVLKVCMLGQYQRTPCQAPVFPLLFNQNMVFEKTFSGVVDPADVADLLEADTTTFELIQLVPPESQGELVAAMNENSRRFLYPAARPFPGGEAAERDAPMRASSSFPGIVPKVKFSTTSIIEESGGRPVSASSPTGAYSPVLTRSKRGSKITSQSHRSTSSRAADWNAVPEETWEASALNHRMSRRSNSSPLPAAQTNKKEKKVPVEFGFQQPTLSSLSRTLSPYTHRRLCQLSVDNRQRVSHLQLGPQHFRKKTESLPPLKASGCHSRRAGSSPPKTHHHRRVNISSDHKDSHTGGFRSNSKGSTAAKLPSSPERAARTKSPVRRSASAQPSLSAPESPNVLNLSERFQTRPSYWEEIHRRVQRILRTHRTSPEHLKTLHLQVGQD